MTQVILAGDVGGTKTWLGLFSLDAPRPAPLETRRYPTLEFDGLKPIVTDFLERTGSAGRVAAACLGVAGPVRANVSKLTNVPWVIDGAELGGRVGIASVHLLNDLEAMAHAVPRLATHELAVIQTGTPLAGANAALIAPGTGLGEAGLHAVGTRFVPLASEGGNADFAARTPRELELVSMLSHRLGRVALEDVVSGPGLVNLHALTHQAVPCSARSKGGDPDRRPDAITTAALAGDCAACVEALDMFVSALGAAAGNLALRTVATGGLYIGGGIAPRIQAALQTDRFIASFTDKGPMRPLLEQIPVSMILEPQAALIGAAIAALDLV